MARLIGKWLLDAIESRPEQWPGLNYSVLFWKFWFLAQTWDTYSLSLSATKFRIVSSIDLPKGGPEGMDTHAQPEQTQPSIRFAQIFSQAMPDYSVAGGISHYAGFPSLALICLSIAILADSAIRG
jgi:hypothetical protein